MRIRDIASDTAANRWPKRDVFALAFLAESKKPEQYCQSIHPVHPKSLVRLANPAQDARDPREIGIKMRLEGPFMGGPAGV